MTAPRESIGPFRITMCLEQIWDRKEVHFFGGQWWSEEPLRRFSYLGIAGVGETIEENMRGADSCCGLLFLSQGHSYHTYHMNKRQQIKKCQLQLYKAADGKMFWHSYWHWVYFYGSCWKPTLFTLSNQMPLKTCKTIVSWMLRPTHLTQRFNNDPIWYLK